MAGEHRRIFVTATDTGAGKTWLTAQAVRVLHDAGLAARAFKPVACGLDATGDNEDVRALLDAQRLDDAGAVSLYRFALPAAPSQAAAAEGRRIDPDALLRWCDERSRKAGIALIEGVGGLMVPLTEQWLVRDWLAGMPDCEVWLVVGCRLGAINHALLTLSVLQAMGRSVAHLFVNAARPQDEAWLGPVADGVRPLVDKSTRIHTVGHNARMDFASLAT